MEPGGSIESGARVRSTKLEVSVTRNMVDGATAKPKERATVGIEDRAAVNAKARGTGNAEDCATFDAENRATVKVELGSTVKAEYRATANAAARAAANAEDRATVNAEARARVNAEARETVYAEDGATVIVAAPATVKAEDRAAVNAEARPTVDAQDRATVKVEAPATVNAEARATVNVEDSSVNAAMRLARSRALFRQLDSTRTARRKDARALTTMDAEQKTLEFASRRILRRMRVVQKDHADEIRQKIFDEVRAIDSKLSLSRMSMVNGACGDARVAVARQQEELLTSKKDALSLARMSDRDMLREVGKRNRAKRIAILDTRRRQRHDAKTNREALQAMAASISVSRDPEDRARERELTHALCKINPHERAREIAKVFRANRIAKRALQRHKRRASDKAMDDVAARILRGRLSAEATPNVGATRELSCTLTEMDPQERAREIARMFRANRSAACAIQRQRRKTQAKERAKLSPGRYSLSLVRVRNQWHAVAAEARACQGEADCEHCSGVPESAEAGQDNLQATREHANAQALAETDDPQELQRGGGEVHVEIRVDEEKGRGITADEASSTSAKKKLRTDEQELAHCMGAGGTELQTGGVARLNGSKTGEMDGEAAVVDGTGAGGFLFVDPKQEELRAKAIVEVVERVAGDAVEVESLAGLAWARHAETARRRAKTQEKMERRASRDAGRDAKRLKKMRDLESRTRSRPVAAGREKSSDVRSEPAEEVIFRGGRRRGLPIGGGGGGEGESAGSGGGAAGADIVSAYDFAERATRFESSFAAADATASKTAVPITILANKASFEHWLESQSPQSKSRIKSLGHDTYKAGRVVMVPFAITEGGRGLTEVAFCVGEGEDSLQSPFSLCSLREKLPAGTYALQGSDGDLPEVDAATLSWALGSYSFDRYKSGIGTETGAETGQAKARRSKEGSEGAVKDKVLAWPAGGDKRRVSAAAAATFLVRDLISTQAEDMGPQHLEDVLAALAKEFHGNVKIVKGDDLLKKGDSYPMIHAIGCAAVAGREPRLLDLTWTPPNSEGNPNLPKVTLVGKGVCLDTGGLDYQPAPGALAMKMGIGGAAQVLGLARMIMAQELPVRLRVLVPAVDVDISGDDGFRPGCVLVARNGMKSEVGNTENAEGLLVLADALVEASSESPDLIIDCATLTGAARVALGAEISSFFCKDEEVAAKMHSLSGKVFDQVWRRPLWDGYPKQLPYKVVRLRTTGGGYGGAVSAALFLEAFVGKKASAKLQEGVSGGGRSGGQKLPWIHMDFLGFNASSRPGKPEGGEAQGMRALYELLEDMFVA